MGFKKVGFFHARDKFNSPSKWSGGVPLLWKGNEIKHFLSCLVDKPSTPQNPRLPDTVYLYESARNAIFHFAKYIGLGEGDRVQVVGFTCDAVTDAFLDLGCDVVLYDLNQDLQSPNFEIEEKVKLVVCQVSFGVPSIQESTLDKILLEGVPVLVDKSLSYGASDFQNFGEVHFPTIMSFEVSKSFTIGWGGLLTMPRTQRYEGFRAYFNALGTVSHIDDFFRMFRSIVCLLMSNKGGRFTNLLWLLLRLLNFHRASADSSKPKYRVKCRMGYFSRKVFKSSLPKISDALERSNQIHGLISPELRVKGLKVGSQVSSKFSTPRILFFVAREKIGFCVACANAFLRACTNASSRAHQRAQTLPKSAAEDV